ncbi:hypothetical protein [Candidatus Albibeggiatoa sp. nov. BB20]|uniref:hypothetical protein n=1 Tax=Candidatus Albibeggiatoa sp. nov. BB20 TaxID=3162723 RepID=UPI003365B26C
MQQAIKVDSTLLQEAIYITGLHQEQALEAALKLLIQTTSQKHLWQQQAMQDEQLHQAGQQFNQKQWKQCQPSEIDNLL